MILRALLFHVLLIPSFSASSQESNFQDFLDYCEQGNSIACFLVGNSYYKGEDVGQDYAKANDMKFKSEYDFVAVFEAVLEK